MENMPSAEARLKKKQVILSAIIVKTTWKTCLPQRLGIRKTGTYLILSAISVPTIWKICHLQAQGLGLRKAISYIPSTNSYTYEES